MLAGQNSLQHAVTDAEGLLWARCVMKVEQRMQAEQRLCLRLLETTQQAFVAQPLRKVQEVQQAATSALAALLGDSACTEGPVPPCAAVVHALKQGAP